MLGSPGDVSVSLVLCFQTQWSLLFFRVGRIRLGSMGELSVGHCSSKPLMGKKRGQRVTRETLVPLCPLYTHKRVHTDTHTLGRFK